MSSNLNMTPVDNLEKLGNLILNELKLIRNDMKAEVRQLGKQIKLLQVKNNDEIQSNTLNTTFSSLATENYNEMFSFCNSQASQDENDYNDQSLSLNDNLLFGKSKLLNKGSKHSLTDIVDKLKNKSIVIKKEVESIDNFAFASLTNKNCINFDSELFCSQPENEMQNSNSTEQSCTSIFETNSSNNTSEKNYYITKSRDVAEQKIPDENEVLSSMTIENNCEEVSTLPATDGVIEEYQQGDFLVSLHSTQDNFPSSELIQNLNEDTREDIDSLHDNEISIEMAELSQITANFKCQFCMKPFRHYSSYQSHLRTHTGEKPFVCTLCNKTFSQKGNLKTHMLFHTNEKPYVCKLCNKKFVQKSSLTNHLRIHTGEKPFHCSFCSKRFAHKSNLYQHEQLHKNIKPHVCEFCDKRFLQKCSLTTHMRCHTGEKPFTCLICGKCFARKSYLKQHMVLHDEGNRLHCQICDKTFAQRRNFEAHMDRHSRNQIFQCDICRKTFKKAISLMAHRKIHDM